MDEATRISLKDQFNSLLVRAIEGRRGGMALMRVLENWTFTIPRPARSIT